MSFLTNFKVFGYLMKHDFQVYDIKSQTNPYIKRKSGMKLSKFLLIKSDIQTAPRF